MTTPVRDALKGLQSDILMMLINGKTVKAAAREFGLTPKQASCQLEQARKALGKRTTLQLAVELDREARQ